MDKRDKIEAIEAAMELVKNHTGAYAYLKGIRAGIISRPWSLTSIISFLRLNSVRYTDDIAMVFNALADDLAK